MEITHHVERPAQRLPLDAAMLQTDAYLFTDIWDSTRFWQSYPQVVGTPRRDHLRGASEGVA